MGAIMAALALANSLLKRLSPRRRIEVALRAFAFFKIPLLSRVAPRVVELSDSRVVVRVKLRRFTKNHLGSMYLGALAIGAECTPGVLAMDEVQRRGRMPRFIYKDFKAEFLRRPDGDVYFVCDEGAAIRQAVASTLKSGERVSLPVQVIARVGGADRGEPVARFVLTLSMKR